MNEDVKMITVNTPVDIQMRKFNMETVVKTFTFHAVGEAEAMNSSQSATANATYQSAVKAAMFDNPACGLVPASFLNALAAAFDDFMCVDAVEDVCSRLTFDGKSINFKR